MSQNSKLFAKFFLNNEELLIHILNHHPQSFLVLSIMAQRAKSKDDIITSLRAGECFLGDYEKMGLSRQQYRTAKANLTKWKFATFKPTNKGTIASMLPNPLFEVYNPQQQPTNQPTPNQRPTTNGEGTRRYQIKDIETPLPPLKGGEDTKIFLNLWNSQLGRKYQISQDMITEYENKLKKYGIETMERVVTAYILKAKGYTDKKYELTPYVFLKYPRGFTTILNSLETC